jgi:hypothetical protein
VSLLLKVNVFSMVANWKRENPRDSFYEMPLMQPMLLVTEGRTLADVVIPLNLKKEHT